MDAIKIHRESMQERREAVLKNMWCAYVGASVDFGLVILIYVAYIGWLII
jgi:hypothetical protein